MPDQDSQSVDNMLVDEYFSLLGYARSLTADRADAADLVQTVAARLLAHRPEISDIDSHGAWLRTVLLRTFIDERRRARREQVIRRTIARDHGDSSESVFAADDRDPSVPVTIEGARAMIDSLPVRYRLPFELYAFENLSYAEIGVRLHLPSQTVGSRLNRARKHLRAWLTIRRRRG